MQVEIWSDVVCPWCYIGRRRFTAALAAFEHADDVEVVWRSFELDRHAPAEFVGDYAGRLAEKYGTSVAGATAMIERVRAAGAAEGLDLRLDAARTGNTFDAHRVLHLARERGAADAVGERLFRGYFTDGEPIGDPAALVRLGADAGLDAAEVRAVLDGDRYADAVRADEAQAAAFGITGVPFFVLDRALGVSGAQPTEVLLDALRQGWAAARPVRVVAGGTAGPAPDGCSDDACAP